MAIMRIIDPKRNKNLLLPSVKVRRKYRILLLLSIILNIYLGYIHYFKGFIKWPMI